jgi:hypothetical protein
MQDFNISTNIIRDEEANLNYIVTKNASENFDIIASNYKNNNKFQAIIGSYGTGKSSFLWAFEQNLKGKRNYFKSLVDSYPNIKDAVFIKLIGEYKSISNSLAKVLTIDDNNENIEERVLEKLSIIVKENWKKKAITILIIDEFGKFLEYAVKNNPDREVYFIQLLAEFFNNAKQTALSISSLHQNFASYGQSLNKEQFKEWEKVKGRLKEVTFNEPIDQLLFFASERNHFVDIKLKDRHKKIFNLILKHNISDKKRTIDKDLAEKLLPIDYISAEIIAKSLQRYGQNERSLFSFLDLDETYSFKWFHNKSIEDNNKYKVYNLDMVFNYIIEHYFFVISSNTNSDLTMWNSIKSALDQVDTRLNTKHIIAGRQIIKTIGLLNIFSNAGAIIDREFIENYSNLALGIENPEEIITELESQKIIAYKNFKTKYVFVDWTDLNIDHELQNADVRDIKNIAERISEIDEFHPVLVKSEYFRTGTPRLFEYHFSNSPIDTVNNSKDGIINYVFSENEITIENYNQPILYAVFKNTNDIIHIFNEIDRALYVKSKNRKDISAIKELDERILYSILKLKSILVDEIYANSDVQWYYAGKKQNINSRFEFNQLLNTILQDNYAQTPILKSELVNKSKLSTPISLARKNLITQLIGNRDKENIGFDSKKFPPEKTIYLSLLRATGIHRYNKDIGTYELGEPSFELNNPIINSYRTLWDISVDFLEQSKKGKLSIKSFAESLLHPPLKLKQGFVDFWIPLFLITKKDEYALFNENGYIPNIDTQVFDVMFKSPQKFFVKAFDVSGIKLEVFNKYKSILNQSNSNLPSEKDFINTIKPFILFVRSLPYYSLKTKNLSQYAAELREAIQNAKDPEKAFFEEFPKALNYSEALQTGDSKMLEGFVDKMESSIMELRSSYDNLVNRFEEVIITTLKIKKTGFESYQKHLKRNLKSIDSSILNSKLRNLKNNCVAPKTERKAFLEGIAFAILEKPLYKIDDHEEAILHKEFSTNYKRLLNLVKVHELKASNKEAEVFGINIFDTKGDERQHRVVIAADKVKDLNAEIKKIKASFNGIDKDLKRAVLIQMLKEEMK